MPRNISILIFSAVFASFGMLFGQTPRQPDPEKTISRIAIGSCAHQDKKQPVLNQAANTKPDLFLYLGDNIYGDTRNMDKLRGKYEKLGEKKEFKRLCKTTPILATWDDHDYGENDAGREYPFKEESKEIFLDFWNEPESSSRRDHPGIYHAHVLGKPGQRVQIILLDTRTFRDHLMESHGDPYKNDYRPNPSPDSTFLGEAQWKWLEQQLQVPAEVRIIATSNQFSHAYNGWESWSNVPHERQQMIAMIQYTRAKGVIFVSGDVHWGELSRMDPPGGYPLYDLTSSGITQTWRSIEGNVARIGPPMRDENFGLINIDWKKDDPEIEFVLKDKKGKQVLSHQIRLSELSWGE